MTEPESMPAAVSEPVQEAAEALRLLRQAGWTVATAESLTGGGLGALLTAVPGASASYVGGVIAYATRAKVDVLGVDAQLLEEHGVVSAPCAAAMARAVRHRFGADLGVATTGVAGPERQEERPVGTVFVAVSAPGSSTVAQLHLPGEREEVRAATSGAAVEALLRHLRRT